MEYLFHATFLSACIAAALLVLTLADAIYYTFIVPQPLNMLSNSMPNNQHLGPIVYWITYVLSLVRLPFAIIPYFVKLLFFCCLRAKFRRIWHSNTMYAIRLIGDFVNIYFMVLLISFINNALNARILSMLLVLSLAAESIRLLLEKGQMIFSGVWQLIPHRRIASKIASFPPKTFRSWLATPFSKYSGYYALSDPKRSDYITRTLKTYSGAADQETAKKLEYFRSFRIVHPTARLRTGLVRDVATGDVYIHKGWASDPWLLIGQAIRRSPWIFDPRYLARPFKYRSEANRLLTLFVLRSADLSPPYWMYQLGHSIKNARYDFFYRICHWLRLDIEERVGEDGTYKFDQFICFLEKLFGHESFESSQRCLWADHEVIQAVNSAAGETAMGKSLTKLDVATKFTYPLIYLEEILWKNISNPIN